MNNEQGNWATLLLTAADAMFDLLTQKRMTRESTS